MEAFWEHFPSLPFPSHINKCHLHLALLLLGCEDHMPDVTSTHTSISRCWTSISLVLYSQMVPSLPKTTQLFSHAPDVFLGCLCVLVLFLCTDPSSSISGFVSLLHGNHCIMMVSRACWVTSSTFKAIVILKCSRLTSTIWTTSSQDSLVHSKCSINTW